MFFNALKCDYCAKLIQLNTQLAHDKAEVKIPKDWYQIVLKDSEFLHFCSKTCIEKYMIS